MPNVVKYPGLTMFTRAPGRLDGSAAGAPPTSKLMTANPNACTGRVVETEADTTPGMAWTRPSSSR
jgi:hypothetical protein